ncbi:hypothetical protein ACFX14_007525 [Malus domestica]
MGSHHWTKRILDISFPHHGIQVIILIASASSSTIASAYARLWKHLWKANIPPKVKNFTWTACHDILPTKVNLHKKGVGVEVACGVCQGEEETVAHVLLTCPFARAVWFSSPFGLWLSGSIRILLKVAQLQGFQQVVVESDSQKVIAVLNGTYADSSALGMIAEDVLQLASNFSRVKFIHASRLCNGVAHHLAKFALSSSNNLVWIEEPPTLIHDLLLQDICNSK